MPINTVDGLVNGTTSRVIAATGCSVLGLGLVGLTSGAVVLEGLYGETWQTIDTLSGNADKSYNIGGYRVVRATGVGAAATAKVFLTTSDAPSGLGEISLSSLDDKIGGRASIATRAAKDCATKQTLFVANASATGRKLWNRAANGVLWIAYGADVTGESDADAGIAAGTEWTMPANNNIPEWTGLVVGIVLTSGTVVNTLELS
jgi:hypothetical protein